MYEDRKSDRMGFDTGPGGFGSGGQQSGSGYTYSYEPQNGGNGWKPEKPPRRSGAIPILTVILCVLLSFAAGVGGATMAYNSIVRSSQNGTSQPLGDRILPTARRGRTHIPFRRLHGWCRTRWW